MEPQIFNPWRLRFAAANRTLVLMIENVTEIRDFERKPVERTDPYDKARKLVAKKVGQSLARRRITIADAAKMIPRMNRRTLSRFMNDPLATSMDTWWRIALHTGVEIKFSVEGEEISRETKRYRAPVRIAA